LPSQAREASEGWWGKKDSNLRSHKTADLQLTGFVKSAPQNRRIGK
jgi:hypothetical protein